MSHILGGSGPASAATARTSRAIDDGRIDAERLDVTVLRLSRQVFACRAFGHDERWCKN